MKIGGDGNGITSNQLLRLTITYNRLTYTGMPRHAIEAMRSEARAKNPSKLPRRKKEQETDTAKATGAVCVFSHDKDKTARRVSDLQVWGIIIIIGGKVWGGRWVRSSSSSSSSLPFAKTPRYLRERSASSSVVQNLDYSSGRSLA